MIYRFFRACLRIVIKWYYREIEVIGDPQKISDQSGIILTPNHQNAFVDAIILGCIFDRPIVSLARADVFAGKWVLWFLDQIKMLPVFRPRDGVDILAKNQITFDKCAKILQNKGAILIFPEGNHSDQYRLRNLQKGFARIGFQAANEANFKTDIKVVPIAINYEKHDLFQGALMVHIAKPIPLNNYKNSYEAKPQKAYNEIRKDLMVGILEGLVHIPKGENYPIYDRMRRSFIKIQNPQWKQQIQFLNKCQDLSIHYPEKEKAFIEEWLIFEQFCKKNNLPAASLDENHEQSKAENNFIYILLSPFTFLGNFFWSPIFYSTDWIVKKAFKDHQFHNGVKMVLAPVITIIVFAFIFLFIAYLTSSLFFAFLVPFIFLLLGAIAWKSRIYFAKRNEIKGNLFEDVKQEEAWRKYQAAILEYLNFNRP